MRGDRLKNPIKICFLSYTHPYDDTRVFHKEAFSLSQAGYEVTHLAPGSGECSRELGIHIVTFAKKGNGLMGKLSGLYGFFRKAFELRADCYHCNEIESWMVGCLLKIFRRGKLVVFDIHEHYPSRAAEPHFPRWFRWIGGPVVRILFFVLTPFTDYFIFAKRNVASDFSSRRHESEFVFNYAPLRMQPQVKTDISGENERGLDASITAIHIGPISRARGWPQLLQALAGMKCRELNVLLLGGVHEGEGVLMDEASRLGVADRVRIKSTVPYEQVFSYLQSSKIGLMLYQPGILNHVYAFPIKMYDYMLAGLPFIAPDFAVEVEPVVREEKCGLLLDTSRPDQIAQALDWFCENLPEAEQMGRRGTRAVLEKYNWEKEKEKLLSVYEKLSNIIPKKSRGRLEVTIQEKG